MIYLQFLTDINGNGITSTLNSGKQSLDVNLTGGSTGQVDESSWTAGSSLFDPIGGVFNDSAAALTSGQQGTARSTANRALHINLRNSSGSELGNSNANGLFVRPGDGTNSQSYTAAGEAKVSVTQPLPAGTNAIGSVELLDSGGTNKASINAAGQLSVHDTDNFSSSAAITQVAVTNSNTSILASNANRKGFTLWNGTNKTVFVAFGATATTSAYTMQLAQGAFYEAQVGNSYTGAIAGITSAAATGNMQVTELS